MRAVGYHWFYGCGLALLWGTVACGFDLEHTGFRPVLSQFVTNGLVRYAALQQRPQALEAYLDELARVSENEFRRWPEADQLAFLINLYNATTLQLVIAHYPISSIKQIGGLLKGPWDQPVVRLFGRKETLDQLEHDRLRKTYREPRVHFALVCAARGCPPLREEPYVGDRLDRQLTDQGKAFLRTTDKNRIDPESRTLFLSPIFKWFQEDFTGGGKKLSEFVAPFFRPSEVRLVQQGQWRIRYTKYDWALNDAALGQSGQTE